MISELHGNSNREDCKDCGKDYIRGVSVSCYNPGWPHYTQALLTSIFKDFRAVAPDQRLSHDHRTGRKCAICGGHLLDCIINFGENLPDADLQRACEHAEKSDVLLVLGSSLTVTPANEIPEIRGRRSASFLAICNLQRTPIDGLADLRVFSKSDDVMTRVMAKLDLPIPPFILQRRLAITNGQNERGKFQLIITGVDVDGTPVTFLRSVRCCNNRRVTRAEPLKIDFRGGLEPGTQVELELEFMGHYREPILSLNHEFGGHVGESVMYDLKYNPSNGSWDYSRAGLK
jgi:hypothetical protein